MDKNKFSMMNIFLVILKDIKIIKKSNRIAYFITK